MPIFLLNASLLTSYSRAGRSSRGFDAGATQPSVDAVKKFGSAKAISSDMYFGDKNVRFKFNWFSSLDRAY